MIIFAKIIFATELSEILKDCKEFKTVISFSDRTMCLKRGELTGYKTLERGTAIYIRSKEKKIALIISGNTRLEVKKSHLSVKSYKGRRITTTINIKRVNERGIE